MRGVGGDQISSRRAFLGGAAILEAFDIEEMIMLPGLRALRERATPLPPEHAELVTASIGRHLRSSDVLAGMLLDSVADLDDTASALRSAPGALSVRAQETMMSPTMGTPDPDRVAMIRMAFLLVLTHALSDPTDCGTASPSLNLMPPPLHRDRAMLDLVLAQVVADLTPTQRRLFEVAIGKAVYFVSVPDEKRLAATEHLWLAEGTSDLSLVRLNPHSLDLTCRRLGVSVPRI